MNKVLLLLTVIFAMVTLTFAGENQVKTVPVVQPKTVVGPVMTSPDSVRTTVKAPEKKTDQEKKLLDDVILPAAEQYRLKSQTADSLPKVN